MTRLRSTDSAETVLALWARSSREHADMLRQENADAATEEAAVRAVEPLFPHEDLGPIAEPWVIAHHDAMAEGLAALAAGEALEAVQARAREVMAPHGDRHAEDTAEMLANTLKRAERDHGKRRCIACPTP